MAGSSFGTLFRITTWGESHGAALGAVVDGCPSGLSLSEADLQAYLDRRSPGKSRYATARKEGDKAEILSGVFEGKTTGTPVSVLVRSTDQHSSDYSAIARLYRPGHADLSYDERYGFRDYRGGGRSSGRETIGRVAGGAVAELLLRELGITLTAYTRQIGPVSIETFDEKEISRNRLYMPDPQAAEAASHYLDGLMAEQDSAGGVIECIVKGLPAGVGDPVFEKISANLAKAVCSIGAVKGFEIGDGFAACASTGSRNNDPFLPPAKKEPAGRMKAQKQSNHAGGILGGISDGSPIILRAAFKPTPSISRLQQTVTKDGAPTQVSIGGRHDPVIMPRAVIVVQSMAALVLADSLLKNMTARIEYLENFYR